jgi:ectonucleotide pyrophosphatase/phosphodiesterase family protein 5
MLQRTRSGGRRVRRERGAVISFLFVITLTNFLLVDEIASGSPQSLHPRSSSQSLSSSSSSSSSIDASSYPHSNDNETPQLLIISLDAFRYDYYDTFPMRSLTSLARKGVHAVNGLKGVFSTVTFPSHWTLATGLYEESHGLIGNSFFDPVTKSTFGKSSNERHWFGGEPIWVTAKRHGKRTGVFYWVGSGVDYGKECNPDFNIQPYSSKVPFSKRVDTVVKWLSEDKIDLAMMYYEQPDKAGHDHGAGSLAVMHKLREIDDELERMFQMLEERGIMNKINIIVTADHGMVNMTDEHAGIILYEDDPEITICTERISGYGIVLHFWTKPGREENLVTYLRKLSYDTGGHFDVYSKDEIPERWHYRNHVRIAPVIAVAHAGHAFQILKVRNI